MSGVRLELVAGTATHLRGANGSGKTSLLRVLAGLAAPRRGVVRSAGSRAFVPEKVVLASAMRPGEWLRCMRALRGLPPVDWPEAAISSGLEASVLQRPSATLSKGMLQRIALLDAMHADCDVVLLDEPFAGLDDRGRDWLADRVGDRLAAGGAVLYTDHSSAAGRRLNAARTLWLEGGTCSSAAVTNERLVSICAVHRDGRRIDAWVDTATSDDCLRELLADGWHIERVR